MVAPPEPGPRMDPALVPYLRASGETAEQCLAALLAGDTDRTIRAIVARTLHGAGQSARGMVLDVEDVRADVVLRVLARLRRLKQQDQNTAIESFGAYVASVAHRTCYTHLRRLYPQRARLKNRVRYALTYDPDLTIEQDALGVWRCSLTDWQHRAAVVIDADMQRFRGAPATFAREVLPDRSERRAGIAVAVKRLLQRLGQPVDLDLMVDALAGALGVDDRPRIFSTSAEDSSLELIDPTGSVAQALIYQQYLTRLWDEIRGLPVNQRVAILLNLRDHDGLSALPLLPLTGIATIRQIAEALEMPAPDLASLWRELPLDDVRIGTRLRLTRQQVINLRKSGRERLGRRMVRFGGL